MADAQNPTGGAEAPKVGSPSPAEAGGNPSSTPSSVPAEAGGQETWPAEKQIEYWKGEAKKAATIRDALKSQIDPLSQRARIADELEQKQAEQRKADEAREREAALKRGEFEKIAKEEEARRIAAEQKLAEVEKARADERAQLRRERETERKQSAALRLFESAGGFAPELVSPQIQKAIDDGVITLDGDKVVGAETVIASLRKAYPSLFRGADDKGSPGPSGGSPPQDPRKSNPTGKRGSLAEGPVYTQQQRRELMDKLGKR